LKMTKITGSGSISERRGSADPDPPQNVIDLQHWYGLLILIWSFTDPEPVGYAFPDPATGRRLGLIPG